MFSVSRGRLAVSFYCLLAVLFLSCSLAFAQKITGDISGSITDSSGAVVPKVTITAQHTGTGVTRTTTTSSSGNYTLLELAIGDYKVTASAQGFKTVVRNATVSAGAVTPSDFTLQIGERSRPSKWRARRRWSSCLPTTTTTSTRQDRIRSSERARPEFCVGHYSRRAARPGGGFSAVSINGSRTSRTTTSSMAFTTTTATMATRPLGPARSRRHSSADLFLRKRFRS